MLGQVYADFLIGVFPRRLRLVLFKPGNAHRGEWLGHFFFHAVPGECDVKGFRLNLKCKIVIMYLCFWIDRVNALASAEQGCNQRTTQTCGNQLFHFSTSCQTTLSGECYISLTFAGSILVSERHQGHADCKRDPTTVLLDVVAIAMAFQDGFHYC